jgi:hypothetical protein
MLLASQLLETSVLMLASLQCGGPCCCLLSDVEDTLLLPSTLYLISMFLLLLMSLYSSPWIYDISAVAGVPAVTAAPTVLWQLTIPLQVTLLLLVIPCCWWRHCYCKHTSFSYCSRMLLTTQLSFFKLCNCLHKFSLLRPRISTLSRFSMMSD